MTKRRRRMQEKERRHAGRARPSANGRRLAVGAGATVGATLLMGGVANAANLTVDSLADSADPGHTTLRDAIHVVNTTGDPSSTITFASGLSGTINLNNELQINYPVSIQGPGAGQLAISGQDNVRVFYLESLSSGFDVSISGLTLAHGHAEGSMNDRLGGGIFNYNADLTVASSVLSQNTAAGSSGTNGYGGAICSCSEHGQSLTILDSTLSGNTATASGGGVYVDYAPLTIRNSTINGNFADAGGAGVSAYNPDGPTNLQNSTIAGNTLSGDESEGGGLYSYARPNGFTLTGTTLVGNSAAHGGGIYQGDGAGGPIVLHNSVVANNGATVEAPDLFGVFNTAFSLIRTTDGAAVTDTVPGSDIIGADPQLNGLAPNGGPTQTMKPALSSPVVDKGAAFGLGIDQRGAQRPVEIPTIPNSTAPGADGSDIGAVELQSSDFPVPVTKKKKCKKKKHKKHKRSADSSKKKHKKAKCKKKKKKKKR